MSVLLKSIIGDTLHIINCVKFWPLVFLCNILHGEMGSVECSSRMNALCESTHEITSVAINAIITKRTTDKLQFLRLGF